MRRCTFILVSVFGLSVPSLTPLFAAALTTTLVQPQGETNNWSSPIWDPGPVSPAAGDTCEVLTGARVRTPTGSVASGGTDLPGQTFTFPGDSLQLDGIGFATGGTGELRLKHTFDNTTFAFPGVGGNPGLILNGGMLNDGENRRPTITGSIRAVDNTISSINPGGQNPNQIDARRGFIFNATFSGGGTLTIDYASDLSTGAPSPPILLNNPSPNFTGDWVVNSGWVEGVGLNSFGFGDINVTSVQGPSTLDFDYNLTNPGGTLTLQGTSSAMILDQDLTFGAVTINGTSLSVGVHSFAELNAAFDLNFVNGGTGNLIVVPEPSSFAIVLLAGLGCLGIIRRRA